MKYWMFIEPGGGGVIVGGLEGEGGERGERDRVQDSESSGLQSPTHCQKERGSGLLLHTTTTTDTSLSFSRMDSEGGRERCTAVSP